MASKELHVLKVQLGELLEKRFIQLSVSPWGVPVLFFKKIDVLKRICINYQQLKLVNIKNNYTFSRIEELFNQQQGAKVFF